MPDGEEQRIFFDANLIGVARSLSAMDARIVYPGHPDWPFDQDEDDEVWLPYIGDRDWLTVVRDKKIRYRTTERAALIRHKVRVVVISTVRNLRIAEMADLIADHWMAIESVLAEPPAFYHLHTSGLVKMLEYET